MIMRGIEHRKGVCRIVMQRGLWELKGINTNLSKKSTIRITANVKISISGGRGRYNFGRNVIVLSAYNIGGTPSLNVERYIRSNGFREWDFYTGDNSSGTMAIDIIYVDYPS